MSLLPSSRPKAPEALVRSILQSSHGIPTGDEPVAILAVRGYYRDTMGKPGVNDVGSFDDAMFLVGPGIFKAVNANTDPSKLGWNPGVGKPFAMLVPGLWYFRRGPHKGSVPALRQCTDEEAKDLGIPNDGEFKVWRADSALDVINGTARVDEGYHAINVHRGGQATTSSWGCQTIPPAQYEDFMLSVWEASKKANQRRIPYLLIDGPIA